MPINQLITGVKIDKLPPNARVKRNDGKFRIHLEYLPSFTNDTNDAEAIKKQYLEPAVNILSNAVKPKVPIDGILRVNRQCVNNKVKKTSDGKIVCAKECEIISTCKHEPIPEKFLKKCRLADSNNNFYENGTEGEGVIETDLVVLVGRKACDAETSAWGVTCSLEETLDRPILGMINVCPNSIKPDKNMEENVNTVVHELIHVLGFSMSSYAFFRDSYGKPLVPRDEFNLPNLGISYGVYNFNDKIGKNITRNRSSRKLNYTKKSVGLTLPTVVKEAQEFFNCPSMTEVDLEETGLEGTILSHFDEYVFRDELMSPRVFRVENLTSLTLAFLYDTGWYEVNYCAAKPMVYGYKAGCTLPLEGCYKYMQEQIAKKLPIDPFCDKDILVPPKALRCSADYRYIEFCKVKKTSDPKYDYIESEKGGEDALMEYCPVYGVESCIFKKYDIPTAHPFYSGLDSRCSANTVPPKDYDFIAATCLKTTCESDKYILKTEFGDLTCVNSKDVTVKGNISFSCIPQGTMCPTSDGTICSVTTVPTVNPATDNTTTTIKTETTKTEATKETIKWQTLTKFFEETTSTTQVPNTSKNIQISLFHLIFCFIVVASLFP